MAGKNGKVVGLGGTAGVFRIITLVIGFIALVLAAASLAPNNGNSLDSLPDEKAELVKKGLAYKYNHNISPNKYMALCTDFCIAVFHLSIVITTFVASLAGLMLSLCGGSTPESSKKLCTIYHLVGGVLLIVGGAGWLIGYIIFPTLVTTDDAGHIVPTEVICGRLNHETRVVETFLAGFENVVTAVFGILDGGIYLVTGFLIFKSSPPSEPDTGSSPMEQATEPTYAPLDNTETTEPENTMTEEAAA